MPVRGDILWGACWWWAGSHLLTQSLRGGVISRCQPCDWGVLDFHKNPPGIVLFFWPEGQRLVISRAWERVTNRGPSCAALASPELIHWLSPLVVYIHI